MIVLGSPKPPSNPVTFTCCPGMPASFLRLQDSWSGQYVRIVLFGLTVPSPILGTEFRVLFMLCSCSPLSCPPLLACAVCGSLLVVWGLYQHRSCRGEGLFISRWPRSRESISGPTLLSALLPSLGPRWFPTVACLIKFQHIGYGGTF